MYVLIYFAESFDSGSAAYTTNRPKRVETFNRQGADIEARQGTGRTGKGDGGGGVCLAVNGARSLPALSREARDYLSSSN